MDSRKKVKNIMQELDDENCQYIIVIDDGNRFTKATRSHQKQFEMFIDVLDSVVKKWHEIRNELSEKLHLIEEELKQND